MPNFELTPSEICASVGRQIDLLMTLALAINAGVAAGALQIVLHNADPEKGSITFAYISLVYIGFILEALSIFMGYLARNALVQGIREIFAFDFQNETSRLQDKIPQVKATVSYSRAQFILFILGIIILFIFMLANISLVR